MPNKLKLRMPKVSPLINRATEHIKWHVAYKLDCHKALRDRVFGKIVLITGASSGIGAEVAGRLACAGAIVLLVARTRHKLEEVAQKIRLRGGQAYIYEGNLAVMEDCDRICKEIEENHGFVDILINNAGRSIRRSLEQTFNRFHDFERTMQLNYFGALRMAMNLLPKMMERNEGHIINISSAGVQTTPARFSAYLASKSALDAWTAVAGVELAHTNVAVSTINFPLVRTPMIAPTKVYDYTPTMTPAEAVDWLLEVIVTRDKRKVSAIWTMVQGFNTVLPKTADTFSNIGFQVIDEEPNTKINNI